jgi:hypothetical protein
VVKKKKLLIFAEPDPQVTLFLDWANIVKTKLLVQVIKFSSFKPVSQEDSSWTEKW